ncbi:MAG: ATP synthase F0 subunit C [Planctomycetota bacterium]
MADLAHIAGGFGAALTIIGAAYGISKLGTTALDGGARQPEVAGHLRISMIIAAALIEGLGFFALVICLLCALKPVSAEKAGGGGHEEKPAAAAQEHPEPAK